MTALYSCTPPVINQEQKDEVERIILHDGGRKAVEKILYFVALKGFYGIEMLIAAYEEVSSPQIAEHLRQTLDKMKLKLST